MKRKHEDDCEVVYSRVESQPNFGKMAIAIGGEWKSLGTALGYNLAQLDHLTEIYHERPVKRNRIMLEKWWEAMKSEKEGCEVEQLLSKILDDSGLKMIAEEELASGCRGSTTTYGMGSLVSKIIFDIESSIKKDQLQCYIEQWKVRDEKYFEPRCFSKIKETFVKNGCLTLIASPGDGKTATCMHLALQMMDCGYNILPVNTSKELKKCNPAERTLFILDDPIGTNMLEERRIRSLLKQRILFESCIEKGNTKVIITMRKGLYKEAKHFIQDSFLGKHCFDLSAVCNQLNLKEKEGIMEKHGLPAAKLHITEDYFPGFPVLCHLLSVPDISDSNEVLGPASVIKKQIEDLRRSSKVHQYCALSLLALFDGIFERDILLDMECSKTTSMNSNVIDIIRSCGLSTKQSTFRQLRESLDIMEEVYVMKDQNGNFQFLHDLIYDAVASVYGAENIRVVIQHFSPAFLRSRIRIEHIGFGQIMLLHKDFARFAERISKDLKGGFIVDVFTNPSILNAEFQKCWKTCLLKYSDAERKKMLSYQPEVTMFDEREMKKALDYAILSATPIHWLSRLGMCSFLREMLETFEGTFLKTLPGNTMPLHFAAGYGHLATVKLLLHFNVDVNAKSSLQIDENLSSIGEYYTGFTPLLYACRENHVDVVDCLLKNGANPDLVRDHGGSPMLITADKGHYIVIKTLLQHNADPNICCEHGTSPLFLTSQEGHSKSAITLLEGGALINHKKPSGMSPLGVAVKRGHIDTVLRLLNRGANIHVADNDGNTPLHMAVQTRRTDIAEMLIYRGADPTLRNKGGDSARSMSLKMDGTPLIKTLHGLPIGTGKI
ncbi:uncharacterized protein LOC117331380 [Pecten maximus]|uniref:uncharacterized protein LOC117331380 n=1 Tax=Pecten maximus TaxID=6579 RepID=UPI0014580CB0|nr:uncharacterized protein LOC117331380 [Pecten maximus]